MCFKKYLVLAFLICSFSIFSQKRIDDALYNRVVEIAEQTIESEESNADFNTFLENLEYYASKPININSATSDDFLELGLLTDIEIQKIIEYREKMGAFVEVSELVFIGIPKQKVLDLSIFLTVKSIEIKENFSNPSRLISKMDHQLFTRYQRVLEEQDGYKNPDPSYVGDPNKYYLRYTANYYKTLQIGAVFEKDDGEAFYRANNAFKAQSPFAGFDYKNAYLALKTRTACKYLVLGSYSLQLGQGLLVWSGLALGKSAYSMQAKKMGQMIKPYSSANESLFLKGIATQISINKWTFIPYVSHKKIDANVVQNSVDTLDSDFLDNYSVTSLPLGGYHRTANEIADKDAIVENIAGLSVSGQIKRLELRVNSQTLHYSTALKQGENLYEVIEFSGNQLNRASVDYKYVGYKGMLFGESAIQNRGKQAHLVGAIFNLNSKLDIISIYRNYAAGYYAPYANGFGERKGVNNEKGLFLGFELRPKKTWNINGYIDNYKKPWLTSTTSAPSSGSDFLIQINQEKSREFQHYIRFKYEVNQDNSSEDSPIRFLEKKTNLRFRYHLNYSPLRTVNLRTRVEISSNSQGENKEFGTLIYQDVKFSTFRHRLDWSCRIAYFNTPSFSSAIYAYESDVLYYFSVPAYYNQGTRYYLMAAYDISKKIKIWIRFARWIYTDATTVSSGNSEIQGDTKSDVRVQLRCLF